MDVAHLSAPVFSFRESSICPVFRSRFPRDDWKLPHQARHILRPTAQHHCIPGNHAWLRTQQPDFFLRLIHISNIDVTLDARVANHMLQIRGRSSGDCQQRVLQRRFWRNMRVYARQRYVAGVVFVVVAGAIQRSFITFDMLLASSFTLQLSQIHIPWTIWKICKSPKSHV